MTNPYGNRGYAAVVVAAILMMLAGAVAVPAQTFQDLVNFSLAKGGNPYYGALVQGTDGGLYGTTWQGGLNNSCPRGCGTIFKIGLDHHLTTVHTFQGTDGENPTAGLLLGADGNFYGTTSAGGPNGYGTVFKITSRGTLTTLYGFDGGSNGGSPYGAVVEGYDGNFYGTTSRGGSSNACV